MRFLLSAEQRQFADSLHDLLSASDVPTVVRHWRSGDSAPGIALWRKLAATGVTALAGSDGDPVDLVVAFEQLGRHVVPGPLVESAAVVPTLLAALPDTGLAERWLPELASGTSIATVAIPPNVPYALDADVADLVLAVDGDLLSTGHITGSELSSVDGARRLFAVAPDTALARCVTGPASDIGTLVCAAQLLGAGRAVLDMAVGHARARKQFGRPIGAFQAVKHQLADVLVGIELARPLLYGAAVTMARRDISAAKVACGDAAHRAARVTLQVHGAVGYTDEHDLSLWLTKIRALCGAWGTGSVHRARVLAALVDRGETPCG
ncbi:MAG TPA: acyl-CoA dehydrogenase [Pseudonocardiaceae bacterium]|nr:acyl-CoA dehydrogenase [Pseudonocardiaceae bacterium]